MTGVPNDREIGRAMSPTTSSTSGLGPDGCGQFPGSIGVLELLDKSMPIGIASALGRIEGGVAVWVLRVHGADLQGRMSRRSKLLLTPCNLPIRRDFLVRILSVTS